MLRLEFNNFWKVMKEHNYPRRPTVNYVEDDKEFKIFFRTEEGWSYCTLMSKEVIARFSEEVGIDLEDTLKDFRMEYLKGAIVVEEEVYEKALLKIPIQEPASDYEEEVYEDNEEVFTKELIDAGDDVVDESDDYETFINKVLASWEKKAIDALKNASLTKNGSINIIKYNYSFKKTFGEFVSGIMNSINTRPFLSKLRGIIKVSFNNGVDSAEKELDMNISFDSSSKISALENQQLTGYLLPDGKEWSGIRGVSKELQLDILKTVEDGVRNRKSLKELTIDIQKIFKGSAANRAKMIARTETTRFINEGKLSAYNESGLGGYKAYSAVMDSKTSDICRRLHNKYFQTGIPMDELFIDDATGIGYNYPPSHSNCRCIIEYRVPEK